MKIGKIILPAESPKGFGEGEPLRFQVWANAPQQLYLNVWNFQDDQVRIAAFHALMGESAPQTVEVDVGAGERTVTLDFRTLESTTAALAEPLPDDLSRWLANLPDTARTERHKIIDKLLPNSYA